MDEHDRALTTPSHVGMSLGESDIPRLAWLGSALHLKRQRRSKRTAPSLYSTRMVVAPTAEPAALRRVAPAWPSLRSSRWPRATDRSICFGRSALTGVSRTGDLLTRTAREEPHF